FLRMGKGSLGELTAQLYVALDERYIDQETFVRLRTLANETSRLLGGLIRYLRKMKADNGRTRFSQPATRHP
ncbi:MAG: four helix bundle protein, partial [Candidatus Omnitrophica bacterium]|nr:four helix bundle protein [Candidatus Omnitrophota bacterium]